MFHFEQVAAGLNLLGGYAREQNCHLTHRSLGNKSSYYIEITKDNRSVDFTLSEEYLADFRFPDLIAKVAPAFSGPLLEFELKHKPFKRLEVLVNSIRAAFDNSRIEFYDKNAHPNLLQEIQ